MARAEDLPEVQRIKDDARRRGKLSRRNPDRDQLVRDAIFLSKLGLVTQQIAELLNVHPQTASRYLNDPTGAKANASNRRVILKKRGITPREEAEVKMNRMDLPISEKITMRPVWKRRQRRIYGQDALPPITEQEKADAIKILGDRRLQKYAPALYFEAFCILDEAGQ